MTPTPPPPLLLAHIPRPATSAPEAWTWLHDAVVAAHAPPLVALCLEHAVLPTAPFPLPCNDPLGPGLPFLPTDLLRGETDPRDEALLRHLSAALCGSGGIGTKAQYSLVADVAMGEAADPAAAADPDDDDGAWDGALRLLVYADRRHYHAAAPAAEAFVSPVGNRRSGAPEYGRYAPMRAPSEGAVGVYLPAHHLLIANARLGDDEMDCAALRQVSEQAAAALRRHAGAGAPRLVLGGGVGAGVALLDADAHGRDPVERIARAVDTGDAATLAQLFDETDGLHAMLQEGGQRVPPLLEGCTDAVRGALAAGMVVAPTFVEHDAEEGARWAPYWLDRIVSRGFAGRGSDVALGTAKLQGADGRVPLFAIFRADAALAAKQAAPPSPSVGRGRVLLAAPTPPRTPEQLTLDTLASSRYMSGGARHRAAGAAPDIPAGAYPPHQQQLDPVSPGGGGSSHGFTDSESETEANSPLRLLGAERPSTTPAAPPTPYYDGAGPSPTAASSQGGAGYDELERQLAEQQVRAAMSARALAAARAEAAAAVARAEAAEAAAHDAAEASSAEQRLEAARHTRELDDMRRAARFDTDRVKREAEVALQMAARDMTSTLRAARTGNGAGAGGRFPKSGGGGQGRDDAVVGREVALLRARKDEMLRCAVRSHRRAVAWALARAVRTWAVRAHAAYYAWAAGVAVNQAAASHSACCLVRLVVMGTAGRVGRAWAKWRALVGEKALSGAQVRLGVLTARRLLARGGRRGLVRALAALRAACRAARAHDDEREAFVEETVNLRAQLGGARRQVLQLKRGLLMAHMARDDDDEE